MKDPAEALSEALGDAVEEVVAEGGHPFVRIRAEKVVEASRVLRDECGARMLHQVSGVDYDDHMEVVYHFARFEPQNDFVCVKVSVPREDPVVPRTGASARPTTCSGSGSRATRTSTASCCPRTGRATPFARTTSSRRNITGSTAPNSKA